VRVNKNVMKLPIELTGHSITVDKHIEVPFVVTRSFANMGSNSNKAGIFKTFTRRSLKTRKWLNILLNYVHHRSQPSPVAKKPFRENRFTITHSPTARS